MLTYVFSTVTTLGNKNIGVIKHIAYTHFVALDILNFNNNK